MESNSLGQTGIAFIKTCNEIESGHDGTRPIVSIAPVIKSLKHIQPLDGYVYETIMSSVENGNLCTPYARKSSVSYLPETEKFFGRFFTNMPDGYYPVWEKVGYKFNEECIWELFLLTDLPYCLPKFWHGNYQSIQYFLQTGDLDEILRMVWKEDSEYPKYGFRYKNGYSKLQELNQDSTLLPNVRLISEKEAILHFTVWNDWTGLMNVTVKATMSEDRIIFSQKEFKHIVEYNCGTCY